MQVVSEDTVLYTAQTYISRITDVQQHQAAFQQLGPHIRCPQLSLFRLSLAQLQQTLLSPALLANRELSSPLSQLLLMRQANPAKPLTAGDVKEFLPDAPPSWLLQPRAHKPVSSVSLQWSVAIDAIRVAAVGSAQQQVVQLQSSTMTPPMGGVSFRVLLQCIWDATAQGSTVGMFVTPVNIPVGAFCSMSCSLECEQFQNGPHFPQGHVLTGYNGKGWRDYFSTGAMSGGWDEAAWAAKGLPTTGELQFTLSITSVNGSA